MANERVVIELDADIQRAEESSERWRQLKADGDTVEVDTFGARNADFFIDQYERLTSDLKALRDHLVTQV